MAEIVWHFCTSCHGRLSPFTKFEKTTEAPEVGKKGRSVLLSTFNQSNPEMRRAWCLGERKWVSLSRVTESEVWTMYLNRRGVVIRDEHPAETAHRMRKASKSTRRKSVKGGR